MQSRSYFLLIVLGLTILSIFAYVRQPYSLGLDVKGGVRLVLQIDEASLTPEQRQELPRIQNDLIRILNNRVGAALGVVEGAVSKKGEDQFIVELPDFTDVDEAKRTLNTSARIIVYHARNVTTPVRRKDYDLAGDVDVNGVAIQAFARTRGARPEVLPGTPEYEEMIAGWDVILEGEDVANAGPQVLQDGRTVPEFTFSREGGQKMREWSRRYRDQEENIAFVLDGNVLNIAPLRRGTILDQGAFIDGTFDTSYVMTLTELVKAGALPVELNILEEATVDPTIGNYALEQMIIAGLISFVVICVFLIVYYAYPGVLAMVAMILYALFTLTALKSIGATFSLAAIAAFILSVGMALDANVLAFERVKEELRKGKKLIPAIELGFKRSLSPIFDSNITTILTSFVLFQFGTGPVKGFASTLIVGVAISFFTAFMITRSLLIGLVSLGIGNDIKYFAMNRNWFGEKLEQQAENKSIQIVKNYKKFFLVSAAIIIPPLMFTFFGGIKPNVEFQGGYAARFHVPASETASIADYRSRLEEAGISRSTLKFGEGPDGVQLYITIPPDSGFEAPDVGAATDISPQPQPVPDEVEEQATEEPTEPAETTEETEVPEETQPATDEEADPITGVPAETEIDEPFFPDSFIDAEEPTVPVAAGARELGEILGLPTEGSDFNVVGPTIQQETIRNAIYGVVFASLLIILYITIRFGFALGGFKTGIKFGISAIVTLLHDVLFILGLAAVVGFFLGWEISTLFITAILTVIGFSVHDTIVIFDRIRENLRRPRKGEEFEQLVDRSITQSVARSINTSVTGALPLIVLIAIGTPTPELKFMCLAMLGGIVIGTYSSIFNAAPVLWLWDCAVIKKHGEKRGLVAEAAHEAKLKAELVLQGAAGDQQVYRDQQGGEYAQVKRRDDPKKKASRSIDEDDDD